MIKFLKGAVCLSTLFIITSDITTPVMAEDVVDIDMVTFNEVVKPYFEKNCTSCHGEGRTRETHKLSVKVPAGVDSGDRIRLGGEGEAGRDGGPPGDLYVEINVRTHQIFQRDGADLHCDIPISFATAVLGGSVEVPTLGGQIELKIPAETQSARVFRLRGKGVKPVRGGPVGDLLVRVAVETPVRLNREQQKLVKQLDESMQGSSISHSPREHGWLHGVKAFFERLG